MRILSTESFADLIIKYASEPNSLGCIVVRNAERRRDLYSELNRIVFSEEIKPVRHGRVLSFRNHSMIHIMITSDRLTRIYDDILVDETIDDIEFLHRLGQSELDRAVPDFGEITPSPEMLEYLGGVADGNDVSRGPG